jgi:twitching motility protein PilT
MAQFDKIIKVMLERAGSDIVVATGAEPYLRVEGFPPHVLINRKLTAPHLRVLLGELVGEAAVTQLESADGGEFSFTSAGQSVTVTVRAWNGNIEARLRPSVARRAAVGQQAVARIELAKAPRAASGAVAEARAAREAPRANDAIELDLGAAIGGPAASRGLPVPTDPSDLEFDISAPDSSSRSIPFAPSEPGTGRSAVVAAASSSLPPRPEPRVAPATAAAASSGDHTINTLFRALIKQGGSDLHLSAGERPMIRRDGDISRLDDSAPKLKGEQIMELLRPILPPNNLIEFERDHDTDFAYEIEGLCRFRGNVFLDRRGVGCVFRIIPTEIVTAEKLGLSPSIQNLCYLSKGLVLVTGPTGSGKSTTLSALIDLINRSRHDHLITIEDPIEFVHQNKMCLINQRQVGPHTDSFKRALRAALREDPDVVMVGEMRDLETMAIAMETAETGHLVFATLHTTTSYSTVDRLIDSFPSDRQAQIRVMLSESLKGVVSQTLCKKIGGGRVAAYEILLVNSAISNIIREGKTFQIPSVMQTARKQGMVLLNDALYELVDKKKVEVREAYIKSVDKANFVSQLRAGGHKLDFLGPA